MKGDWTVGKGKQPFELKYNPENPQHAITILGDVTDDYPLQKATSMSF